jgi:hypothetical protein
MKRIIRALPSFAMILLIASPFLSGCKAPCDYPNARGVVMRIINAMPDMPVITVWVNGKAVVKDYPYDPTDECLYRSNYLDGTPLPSGDSVLFEVSSDAVGNNKLISGKFKVNFQRQTFIAMGRGVVKSSQISKAKIVQLMDPERDLAKSLVRFVNAIPDLDSLDIFFKADTAGISLGKPDLTLHYGQATPHLALNSINGLTVTEAGHPDNVIFSLPYTLGGVNGFFATVIVRGETKPIGNDFTAAPILYSDEEPCGHYLLSFKTFAVRIINASRESTLSLWIRSATVAPEDTLNPRGSEKFVADYPNQEKVKRIPAGRVTDYIPLNILLNFSTTFYFAKDNLFTDTIQWIDQATANTRYSKIAVEENPFGTSGKKLSHMNLPDTMTNPSGNFGRVRVINLSPDHASVSVTLGGRTISMVQKQVEFFDVPLSNSNIVLTDGSTTKTYSIPASGIEPISVYILPEQSATPALPILTSQD